MGNRKRFIIAVIIIFFVGLSFYTFIIQKELNGYKEGFYLKGTYQTVRVNPGDSEYLSFSREKEAGENIFYYYKQSDFNYKGTYKNSDHVNMYHLSIDNTSIDGSYILVDHNKIYVINNTDIIKYDKISDEVVIINQ